MTTRAGSSRPRGAGWGRRIGRVLAYAGLGLSGVLVAGLVFEEREAAFDSRRFPAPGRLVDVEGRRMHLKCTGSGRPTVVVDVGAGGWSANWAGLQARLAAATRVCTYDRPGFGWSDPAPFAPTSANLARAWHDLLWTAGERPPFIVAGHSFGGYDARVFASRYRDEVAGVVLVESAHERQWTHLPRAVRAAVDAQIPVLRLMAFAGRFGLLRLRAGELPVPMLREADRSAYRAIIASGRPARSMAALLSHLDETVAEVSSAGDLGDLPLRVVTAGRSFYAFEPLAAVVALEEANARWLELQRELVGLSSRGRQLVSPQATHDIHTDDPNLVVRAILEVVGEAADSASIASRPPDGEARAPR